MKYQIEIKKGKDLTSKELIFLAKETQRVFYGGNNFNKELVRLKREKNSFFFLLKFNKNILSFGFLKPTKIKYLNKNYNIFGIRNVISIKKKKGYGSLLMKEMISFLNKKEKTGIGFTGSNVSKFYKKIGFLTKKGLRNRMFPNYGKDKGEIANWGFYVEGKDKFITKIIKTKLKVKMPLKKW